MVRPLKSGCQEATVRMWIVFFYYHIINIRILKFRKSEFRISNFEGYNWLVTWKKYIKNIFKAFVLTLNYLVCYCLAKSVMCSKIFGNPLILKKIVNTHSIVRSTFHEHIICKEYCSSFI